MPTGDKKTENGTPPEKGVSAAKKFMLKDLDVKAEDIATIRSNEEADELISYLNKKNAETPKENIIKVNGKIGHTPAELPPPDKVNAQHDIRMNMFDKLDPISYKQALSTKGTRRNNGSRLMCIFDEEHPGGRVF